MFLAAYNGSDNILIRLPKSTKTLEALTLLNAIEWTFSRRVQGYIGTFLHKVKSSYNKTSKYFPIILIYQMLPRLPGYKMISIMLIKERQTLLFLIIIRNIKFF